MVTGNRGADSLYGQDSNGALNSRDAVSANDTLDGAPATDTRTTDLTERTITNREDDYIGFP
jgi:hypothetical protein